MSTNKGLYVPDYMLLWQELPTVQHPDGADKQTEQVYFQIKRNFLPVFKQDDFGPGRIVSIGHLSGRGGRLHVEHMLHIELHSSYVNSKGNRVLEGVKIEGMPTEYDWRDFGDGS